jgi:murein DD-endopeptidase MepM/ murein hydrolase activator NlpD
MSKEMQPKQSLKEKLNIWTARAKVFFVGAWRRTPLALRYAGLYLLAMILISSMMFWRFNPARYSYSPRGNGATIPGQNQEPREEPEDAPNQPRPALAAFKPERGDKLLMPIEGGRLLDVDKYVFHINNKTISYRFVEGAHISGEVGRPVRAAWSGVVRKVTSGLLAGQEIWIDNGTWTFIYRGVKNVMLSPGDKVTQGQQLGVLAENESSGYNANFLELCVQWDGKYFTSSAVRELLTTSEGRH